MIRASQLFKLALGLLVAFAGSARLQASDITFDFTSGVGVSTSFSKTVSGYTLTFSNPVGSTYLYGTDSGLSIGDRGYGGLSAFNIQVSGGPLVFKNYEVGDAGTDAAKPFDLSGGTGVSTGNSLASVGVFNYNGSMLIAPGDTVLLIVREQTTFSIQRLNT
ncbi:MAG: hypothetical protein NT172_14010 [Planctomycetota bacterium]|nr:hypothetical protein [Planctomycetota bacterium]